jgi:hypothetical protein
MDGSRLTERSSEAAAKQEDRDAMTSESGADLGELRSAATARTQLLLELFPRDAGPSVLPSAESALVLPELSWSNADFNVQQSLMREGERATTEEPEMSPMWIQLMGYVDQLMEAVRAEEEAPHPDRDRSNRLGSEQPIPG